MRNNVLLILHKQDSNAISKNLQQGYNVFVAGSRDEVERVFANFSIQLIISAAVMPGLDGWELCAALKADPAHFHIPVILVAREESMPLKIKSLEAGADALITLPVAREYLEALVGNLIINRKKVSEHVVHPQPAGLNKPAQNRDEDFIKKLNGLVSANMHQRLLNVDLLARQMNMSRPTLYRKIKVITDLTPNELINQARLKQAARLLAAGSYKVFEIARIVGFQTQSSFGKAFIKQFKQTPTQYLQMKRKMQQENRRGLEKQFLQQETAHFE